MEVSADSAVDVVFGLEGTSLPAEYAYDLWREVHATGCRGSAARRRREFTR